MPLLAQQPNMLSTKEVKEAVLAAYPSMPRYKKIKLAAGIIPAYERALEVAIILGEEVDTEPDPSQCDIEDDYLILRDNKHHSIADVYVGPDSKLSGHVVFQSGKDLTEHDKWLLLGESDEDGFIHCCSCSDCVASRTQSAADDLEPLFSNLDCKTMLLPSISQMKVTGVSDAVAEKLANSQIIADSSNDKPKVVSYRPMRRDGNTSAPSE